MAHDDKIFRPAKAIQEARALLRRDATAAILVCGWHKRKSDRTTALFYDHMPGLRAKVLGTLGFCRGVPFLRHLRKNSGDGGEGMRHWHREHRFFKRKVQTWTRKNC